MLVLVLKSVPTDRLEAAFQEPASVSGTLLPGDQQRPDVRISSSLPSLPSDTAERSTRSRFPVPPCQRLIASFGCGSRGSDKAAALARQEAVHVLGGKTGHRVERALQPRSAGGPSCRPAVRGRKPVGEHRLGLGPGRIKQEADLA